MFYFIITLAILLTAWVGWEIYRAPVIEDENDTFLNDPTTTCWDDDDDSHTEGSFH